MACLLHLRLGILEVKHRLMASLVRTFLSDTRGATAMDFVVIALLMAMVAYAAIAALATEIEETVQLIRGTMS